MASRNNYLDLDPTYVDGYGRPLLRMTFDFPENDRRNDDDYRHCEVREERLPAGPLILRESQLITVLPGRGLACLGEAK